MNSVGNGMFAAVSVVYFVRFVGLTPGEVGAGLALAGAAALPAGLAFGHLADRRGAKPVFIGLTLVHGAAVAAYPLAGSWRVFVAVTVVAVVAERATAGVRNAFLASIAQGVERVRLRAYLRSVMNAGTAAGAAVAGVALALGTERASVAVLLLDAATFAFTGLLVRRIAAPAADAAPTAGGQVGIAPGRSVWHNRRFLAMSMAQAMLSLHAAVLTVGLPLWIVARTDAPRVTVAAVLVASTLGAIALQVPASARAATPAKAAASARTAGWLLAGACLVFAGSSGRTGGAVLAAIAVGGALRLGGELLQSVSGWAMSFAAAPPGRIGVYQAAYSMAFTVAGIAGPLLCAAVVEAPGVLGWLLLAAVFSAAGQVASRAAPLHLEAGTPESPEPQRRVSE